MTDAARDLAPMANPDGRDANVWSEYEIETQTSLVDRALRTLKHGDAFAVLDSYDGIGTIADTAEGLFYRDTRYPSHYELRIEGKRPLLLSSAMHEDKAALSVALTNPETHLGEHDRVPRDTIFLERTKFVWNAVCYERVSINNCSSERTSRYVLEENRLCCAGSGTAGCVGRRFALRTNARTAELSRVARLKSHGPSSRGCLASITPRSAANRSVRAAMPMRAAGWLRFSQAAAPSGASRKSGMR